MNFLWTSLVAIGIVSLVQPFTYMFLELWYRKNPDAEKTNSFELLDAVFRHKYTKAIYIAVGVICFIAAVIVFEMYISPTL